MKFLKLIYILPFFLCSCFTSNIDLATEELKRGMNKTQVEQIMGIPDDIQEKSGHREDWVYYGHASDDFRNIRLVFIDDKYMRWMPAGRNTQAKASYDAAVLGSFESSERIIDQTQRNINAINTQSQLNMLNNNLNNLNNTLRRY